MTSMKNKDLNKRCESLESTVNVLQDKLTQALASLDKSSSASKKVDETAAATLSGISEELTVIKKELSQLKDDLATVTLSLQKQEESLDELEQYSRRNCLILHGVKEVPREDLMKTVLGVFRDKLGIDLLPDKIDRVHRLGVRERNRTAAQMVQQGKRAIIIRFVAYRDRDVIWRAKRKLKNTGILLTESLTAKRLKLLQQVKERYGQRNSWSLDGRIFVLIGNTKRVITNERELQDIIQERK